MHNTMYYYLKERQMLRVCKELCPATGRTQRVLYLTGIRNSESARRVKREEMRREGAIVWVNPMLHWTSEDMNTYRRIHQVPRNEVSDLLHMSGECLCGAFAKPDELEMIEDWFPGVVAEIRELEDEAKEKGVDRCTWGWGHKKELPSKTGPMCAACDLRYDQPSLFDE
jgi:3'-phosphoadenosine 5'-phosphosulfate sulfotransferase (PAPS reductase)/FAD synthetase